MPVSTKNLFRTIGEWEQDEFTKYSKTESGKESLEKLMCPRIRSRVESFDALWDDLGFGTAAFAFKCPKCGKIEIICQDY